MMLHPFSSSWPHTIPDSPWTLRSYLNPACRALTIGLMVLLNIITLQLQQPLPKPNPIDRARSDLGERDDGGLSPSSDTSRCLDDAARRGGCVFEGSASDDMQRNGSARHPSPGGKQPSQIPPGNSFSIDVMRAILGVPCQTSAPIGARSVRWSPVPTPFSLRC